MAELFEADTCLKILHRKIKFHIHAAVGAGGGNVGMWNVKREGALRRKSEIVNYENFFIHIEYYDNVDA